MSFHIVYVIENITFNVDNKLSTSSRRFIRLYMISKYFNIDCLLTKLPIELVFYIANIMYHIIHKIIIINDAPFEYSLMLDGVFEYDFRKYHRDLIKY